MTLSYIFIFLFSLATLASTPPELFYKKNGKFISLGSFSSVGFCSGEIPIENNSVTIYCRTVPDIGPSTPTKPPQLQGIYPCSKGQVHGVVKVHFCWGSKGEESYSNGLKNGITKYYYSNGKIKSEAQYLKGQLNGTSIEYSEEGTIIKRAEYTNGQLNGKSYYFDRYSKVGMTQAYINGNPTGHPVYESKYLQELLIMAAGNGDLVALKKYLSQGAKPNGFGEASSTVSAVFKAAEFGKLEALGLLISKGGNVNQFDKYNLRTPLMASIATPQIIRFLLDNGADPKIKNHDGHTALHESVRYGYLETTEILIHKGADLTLRDKDGKTPLQIAESSNHKDKQQFINLLNGKLSAKSAIEERQLKDCKEKMKSLVRYIEVNRTTWEDEFKNCPKESFTAADLNYAFQYAAKKGFVEPMGSLLKKGAELNSRDQDYHSTPLMLAAREGKLESVLFLLNRKANINAQDNFGKTAIMYAVQWAKNKDIVKVLLDNNADTSLKNKDGQTVRDLAKQSHLIELERLFTK